MHSGRWPYRWDFNILYNLICVICLKIRSNAKVGRSTRMHYIYQNLNKVYSEHSVQIGAKKITNWGKDYKSGQGLQIGAVYIELARI